MGFEMDWENSLIDNYFILARCVGQSTFMLLII